MTKERKRREKFPIPHPGFYLIFKSLISEQQNKQVLTLKPILQLYNIVSTPDGKNKNLQMPPLWQTVHRRKRVCAHFTTEQQMVWGLPIKYFTFAGTLTTILITTRSLGAQSTVVTSAFRNPHHWALQWVSLVVPSSLQRPTAKKL